MKKYGMV